jgi:muramoyltetrapeptide carboxypeptidase
MQSRRSAMATLATMMAAAAMPVMASPEPISRRKPARLRPGDVVGLIQPAYPLEDPFDIRFVQEAIRAMGLVPKLGQSVGQRFGYLAGEDKARAADVNAMFADDGVKAVFAVRGGWGCARILPHLDWKTIAANPKLLIGYSDITALHMAIAARAGFATIHGPGAASDWGAKSWDSFRALAFEGAMPTYRNPVIAEDRLALREWRTRAIRGGRASGRLLGGNLTVLTALLGSPYLPDFSGAILFLEDVDEAEYRVDRMLTSLSLAGVLSKVSGIVFGQCTDCKAKGGAYGGFTLSQVLEQHLAPLGVPVFEGAFFGHIRDQFSLPQGVRAEIDADAGTIRLLEPAVA